LFEKNITAVFEISECFGGVLISLHQIHLA